MGVSRPSECDSEFGQALRSIFVLFFWHYWPKARQLPSGAYWERILYRFGCSTPNVVVVCEHRVDGPLIADLLARVGFPCQRRLVSGNWGCAYKPRWSRSGFSLHPLMDVLSVK